MEPKRGSEGGQDLPKEATWDDSPGNRGGRRRVGLLGGSFDPVHAGHLFVAQAALEGAELDEVVFVPAARPPHKLDQVLTAESDRLALLEVALKDHPQFCVDALEFGREGPSYTIDTARALLEELGGGEAVELFLILGGDNLSGLGDWRDVEDLLELVTPLVVHRGEELELVLGCIERALPERLLEKLRAGFIKLEPHPTSSTELRGILGRGEDPGEQLPIGCLEIVEERGLYGRSR